MAQQTPLYIIASPRPRVGKTLLARLLIEFFRANNRPLVGYDLNPREPSLSAIFPTWSGPSTLPTPAARWSCSIG